MKTEDLKLIVTLSSIAFITELAAYFLISNSFAFPILATGIINAAAATTLLQRKYKEYKSNMTQLKR